MATRTTKLISPNLILFLQALLALSFQLPKANSQSLTQQTHPEAEKLTLQQISNDWGNPTALQNWSNTNSIPHCSWTGIQCTDGSVTAITLANQLLYKAIPQSICKLNKLTHLDLSYNNLPGNFPVTLYNCSNLQYLDLSQNLFVGSIPSDINRLSSQLTYLSLSANNFSGSIPSTIGSFPAIQTLFLDSNLFNGTFPVELANLLTLEYLALAYNPFLQSRIPSEFGNLASLKYLWMTNMNLTGEIPETLGKLSELVHLDLAWNTLHGGIPVSIWSLKKLQYYYLFSNNLTGEISGPGAALSLRQIDFSTNQLTGSIPEDFGKLQNLSILFLHDNKLSGEIPASIGLLKYLVDIRLFTNNLTGVLPPELGRYSKLNNFEVSSNSISGQLPEHLCDSQALISLIVFGNSFTGEIPPSVANCKPLQVVELYNNKFSGDFPIRLWSAAKNLTTVIIHHNSFTGILPDVLPGNLSRLVLHNNKLSGRIPASAPSLQVFIADNNLFSGEIPEDLSELSKLYTLHLGNNRLSGSIPPSISSLKLLNDLNLSYNQLTGSIPASIGYLSNLNYLYLSNNQLSGRIPSELNSLKLTGFNFSDNQLSGEIPVNLLIQPESFLGNPGLCSFRKSISNLAVCKLNKSEKSSKELLIILSVLVGIMLMMILVAIYMYNRKISEPTDLESWKLVSFSKTEIDETEIVHGLSSRNCIGRGGSAEVYKITLRNGAGVTIAVKKIFSDKRVDAKLEKQFDAEVEVLSSIRHMNIVQLLGCITSTKSKLVLYEYVENGCLSEWIKGKFVRTESGESIWLDWPKRLKIAIDAAEGLCYMHHHCAKPIVHRDVKSSNILLDKDFGAKIADFGLARILVNAGEPETVSVVAGTFGYMAPECGHSRKVTEKMDVFSFGVVLLELTTGRIPTEFDGIGIADWARESYSQDETLMSALDENISDDPTCIDKIREMFMLGICCTEHSPSKRPSMKIVVEWLKEIEGTARDSNRFLRHSVSDAESYIQYKGGISDTAGLLMTELSILNHVSI